MIYTISDGNGNNDTAIATFTVSNVAPNAVADSYTQTAGTAVDRDVLSNDSDPNGDSLAITAENSGYASIVSNKLRFAAPATSGTYNVTYSISDGNGGTDTAVAAFSVPNVAPNAVNNSYTQTHGTTADRNVLGNDTDPNGDALTITSENGGNASIVNNKIRFIAPSSSGSYTLT